MPTKLYLKQYFCLLNSACFNLMNKLTLGSVVRFSTNGRASGFYPFERVELQALLIHRFPIILSLKASTFDPSGRGLLGADNDPGSHPARAHLGRFHHLILTHHPRLSAVTQINLDWQWH